MMMKMMKKKMMMMQIDYEWMDYREAVCFLSVYKY